MPSRRSILPTCMLLFSFYLFVYFCSVFDSIRMPSWRPTQTSSGTHRMRKPPPPTQNHLPVRPMPRWSTPARNLGPSARLSLQENLLVRQFKTFMFRNILRIWWVIHIENVSNVSVSERTAHTIQCELYKKIISWVKQWLKVLSSCTFGDLLHALGEQYEFVQTCDEACDYDNES